MREKGIWKILVILVVLVTIGSCAAMPSAGDISKSEVNSSSATVYVPDGYSTIQEAVDVASAGDTIIVRDGIYNENIKVNKRLTIRSENGADKTIVKAAKSSNPTFEVTADGVNISGLTIKNTVEYEIPSTPPTLPPIEYISPVTPTPIKALKEPSCGCNTYPEEVPIENFFELSYEFIRIPTENKSLLPIGEVIECPFQPGKEVIVPPGNELFLPIRGGQGISISGVRNVTITGNIIEDCQRGINVLDSNNVTIANNSIRSISIDSIYSVNLNNSTITNNFCNRIHLH